MELTGAPREDTRILAGEIEKLVNQFCQRHRGVPEITVHHMLTVNKTPEVRVVVDTVRFED